MKLTIESKEVEPPAPPVIYHNKIQLQFSGGIDEMQEFIAKNQVYPKSAKDNFTQGIVWCLLEINEKGGSYRYLFYK